eukprot:6897969-Karenia_brevis.AAC.1
MTGEPRRRIFFDMPANAIPILRMIEGFPDLNTTLEIFELLKPGYGLKDAPRAWCLRLHEILVEFGFVALQTYRQVYVLFVSGSLEMILAAHVDYLKGGASKY